MRFLILTTALAAVAFGANPPAIQWQRTFGTEEKYGECVQQTADGGYVIAGDSFVDDLTRNMYLLRTDSQGNTLWERAYGGPHDDYAFAVRQTMDGGFVFCGRNNVRLHDSTAAVVLKLDSLGNVVWTGSGPLDAAAFDIELTADGGYIAVGNFGYWDSIYLRKLDAQGNLQWHAKLPGCRQREWSEAGLSVQQTSDGGYVTGSKGIIKTDSLGNVQWSRTYLDVDVLFSIRHTSDGGYIATGIAPEPEDPEDPDPYSLVLLKTDAQGNKAWKRLYRDGGPTAGRCVRQTSDGGYFVTGESKGPYVLRTNAQGYKLWAGQVSGIPSYFTHWGEPTADGGYVLAAGYILVKLAPDGY